MISAHSLLLHTDNDNIHNTHHFDAKNLPWGEMRRDHILYWSFHWLNAFSFPFQQTKQNNIDHIDNNKTFTASGKGTKLSHNIENVNWHMLLAYRDRARHPSSMNWCRISTLLYQQAHKSYNIEHIQWSNTFSSCGRNSLLHSSKSFPRG